MISAPVTAWGELGVEFCCDGGDIGGVSKTFFSRYKQWMQLCIKLVSFNFWNKLPDYQVSYPTRSQMYCPPEKRVEETEPTVKSVRVLCRYLRQTVWLVTGRNMPCNQKLLIPQWRSGKQLEFTKSVSKAQFKLKSMTPTLEPDVSLSELNSVSIHSTSCWVNWIWNPAKMINKAATMNTCRGY